ncbi:MAG: helicase RepA family protein [Halomonas sp.]|uniref:helicase RepA family protein n=1 Tax=Halomonas sp. TaxID=1486246 RepID=UPI002ACE13FE|nr:helicase RepA family protein [Halomonas sp.]MDZ7854164.1 helicase RepA family protein [Halomonas sp.]
MDATPANMPPFGFASAGDMVAHLKPVAWLVRGFMEADSLALVFGEPGHGKSFLALDWAASVATGTDWHGHPTRRGAVFVVAGEGHNGIARRLKAWELARGVALKGAPLFVSHAAASLADWESAREVVAAVEARAKATGQAPALIVVDTLSRNLGPADENSSADMAAFVRHLDAMRQHWQATVCVVHHSGKDSAKGARGSTVLKGAVDAEYRVAKDDAGVVCLEATKMKDADLPALQAFKLEGVKLPLVDDEGGDVWGAALDPVPDYQPAARWKAGQGKNQAKALAALRALYDDHRDRLARRDDDPETAKVLIDDWRDEVAAQRIDRKRFYDAKQGLERGGWVRLVPPYVELMK